LSAVELKQLWYTRRGDEIRGPYPAGLITRYILLGRIRDTDELSIDQQEWAPVSEHPDLIPDVLKTDLSTEEAQERLLAARRWEDERRGEERRGPREGQQEGDDRRARQDRRGPEAPEVVSHRTVTLALEKEARAGRKGHVLRGTGTLVLIILILGIGWYYASQQEPLVYKVRLGDAEHCSAPPAPRVDWSNCHLEGGEWNNADLANARLRNATLTGAQLAGARLTDGDLAYANLSFASLRDADLSRAVLLGTNLQRADLANVNLQDADLSYANLTGAAMRGANLANARLDNAIWVDKSVCAPGSLGRCISQP